MERTAGPPRRSTWSNGNEGTGIFSHLRIPTPRFSSTLELDMGTIVPSWPAPKSPRTASPRRHAIPVAQGPGRDIRETRAIPAIEVPLKAKTPRSPTGGGHRAITSCTNTSNPSVMIAPDCWPEAVAEGSPQAVGQNQPGPGSRVVTDYLDHPGSRTTRKTRFSHRRLGCTTCIGNSGPTPEPISSAIPPGDLVAAAVLSGNETSKAESVRG
ncbi:MAG: hypothetical protein Ct9H300mP1_38260 [Planctomycetaceae bacterium]|nr:MAG: hypothetical protein Ct9H300mP1_38260 [Planctomycetaceae bacterium]